MQPRTKTHANEIARAVDETLARNALVPLLDFATHTALYADDALFQRVTATIEALQAFICFPLSAGQAMQLYTDLRTVGWQPNATDWPDHADC